MPRRTDKMQSDRITELSSYQLDVHNHIATVKQQKLALHDSLLESFQEIEDDILYDSNSGIITTLYHIENNIRDSIILRASS